MLSQGPNSAGTGADSAAVGSAAWSNPGNVTAADAQNATASVGIGIDSHYLVATGFGFAIPAGATINGIVTEVKRSSPMGTVSDEKVRIVKGGSVGSTDKASGTSWPTTAAYQSYGSNSDLWGQSWTASDVNASNFGVAIQAQAAGLDTAQVDHVRITIYYSAAAGSLLSQGVGQ